jgi:hypothetical protein
MFKIRIVGEGRDYSFDTESEAFEWARKNVPSGGMFAFLVYSSNDKLESMDRFTFTGKRMMVENIVR